MRIVWVLFSLQQLGSHHMEEVSPALLLANSERAVGGGSAGGGGGA